MDFFEQFRRLAVRIENQTSELQSLSVNVNSTCTSEASNDGRAAMIWLKKQEELKRIKKDTEQLTKKMKDGATFVDLATAAAALVNINKERTSETIAYLKKYGYKPPSCANPESEPTAPTKAKDDMSPKAAEEQNCSPPRDEKASDDPFDLPPTPKLSDFGISSDTVLKLETGISAETHPKQSLRSHSSSGTSDISDGLPEAFKQNGSVVTPGIFGGASLVTPARGYNNHNGFPLNSPDLPGCGSFDSPVPPVLQTPGVKQITKPSIPKENEKEPKPVFNLNIEEDSESPIAPVLQTPGIKQIQKIKPDIRAESNLSDGSFACVNSQSDMDTPEMPQLTTNFKDLYTCVSQPVHSTNLGGDLSTVETDSHQLTPPLRSQLPRYEMDDDSTPQMPELTGVYQFPGGEVGASASPSLVEDDYSEDKENVEPPEPPVSKTTESEFIQYINEEEYSCQPRHLTSKVPLEYINTNIDKMNEYIAENCQERRNSRQIDIARDANFRPDSEDSRAGYAETFRDKDPPVFPDFDKTWTSAANWVS